MEEVWGRGKNVWVYGSMGVWEWEEEEMEHGAGGMGKNVWVYGSKENCLCCTQNLLKRQTSGTGRALKFKPVIL